MAVFSRPRSQSLIETSMNIDANRLIFPGFVGSLVVIAAIINSLLFFNSNILLAPSYNGPTTTPSPSQPPIVSHPPIQSPPQIENTAAAVAAAKAATEKANFLARYVNGSFTRQAGKQGVAIVVANENGKLNPPVTAALARKLQNEAVQISPSFFTTDFISDGLFDNALAGSIELFRKLDLPSSLNALVLAREDVQYSKNATLENTITATLRLDITVVPVSGQTAPVTWAFTAYGPGFTKEVARGTAEERLIKQITSDTKMSLTGIIPAPQ